MKRNIIYIVILAAMLWVPVKKLDVSKLLPIQVVSVYKEENMVVIETDTQSRGVGVTVGQALENLKDTANGIIYLDTAEYLMLSPDAEHTVETLRQELKGSVRLCMTQAKIDPAEVVVFLGAHGQLPQLKSWKKGMELPVLHAFENSLTFLKKSKKGIDKRG